MVQKNITPLPCRQRKAKKKGKENKKKPKEAKNIWFGYLVPSTLVTVIIPVWYLNFLIR